MFYSSDVLEALLSAPTLCVSTKARDASIIHALVLKLCSKKSDAIRADVSAVVLEHVIYVLAKYT